MRKIS